MMCTNNPTMFDLAGRLSPENPAAYAACRVIEESEILHGITWLENESSLRPLSTLLRTTRSGASSQSHRQPADRREKKPTPPRTSSMQAVAGRT